MAWQDKKIGRSFQDINNAGAAAFRAGQFLDAEVLFEKAAEIGREMAALHPDAAGPLGGCLTNLAEVLVRMNATPEAEAPLLHAASIFRDQARTDPENYEPMLVQALEKLARVYRGPEFYVDFAASPATNAVARRRLRLDSMASGNWPLPGLVTEEWRSKAEDPLLELLELLRGLMSDDRRQWQPHLAMGLNMLGELYVNTDRNADAEAPLEEAQDQYEELVQLNPDYQKMLDDTLTLLDRASRHAESPEREAERLEAALPEIRVRAQISDVEREEGVSLRKSNLRDELRQTLERLEDLYEITDQPERRDAVQRELGPLLMESLRVRFP